MNVNGRHYRTIWTEGEAGNERLFIIDQTALPHAFQTLELSSCGDVCQAIRDMQVRGAGLIGATAAYGVWLAARTAPAGNFAAFMERSFAALRSTRPTAGNLFRALERQARAIAGKAQTEAIPAALAEAQTVAGEDAEACRRIGTFGLELIREIAARKPGKPVEILTHCNAGWLAFVDYGSALSPVYAAFDAGIPVHVWVDETRPRNQGARLTAWELGCHGVPCDIIADNAGGHLMQHGMVDLVLTGADRVTRWGDAANKIGTYLKALAAADNGVPFYVALPSTTLDPALRDGMAEIPIEERSPEEVRFVPGLSAHGPEEVLICPEAASARNWAFDVTPARLITGLITERGISPASEAGIMGLFPEFA
ncbi:S-methyl-5-thioribose-1-phosphate isomerase [uncultured Mailhella sp.]|uniref:S-methyl-5-thioribose-1-phosphate isomerase n=1 Tax=uncultured Mailhella sp. TaxID=1981031 RepID=UPI002633FE22|nr:S-methyl-5-thioribose-1-phosphate isomerase [uncultured Mailhella sp.]